MDQLPVFYQGSSVGLVFRVKEKDSGLAVPTQDYEAEATLFTRLLSEKIESSTVGDADLVIHRIGQEVFAVNIDGEHTGKLSPGRCSVQLKLTHRETGATLIAVKEIMLMEETV